MIREAAPAASNDVKLTTSKENYLKAIAEAAAEGETVIAASLARWLELSPPAATMALQRLKRDKLVQISKEGRVSLTAEGEQIAEHVMCRHHLIERMLAEIFGMEWYKVHDEAEQLEHAVSEDFEARLLSVLGPGTACPHGSVVGADSADDRRKRGWVLLSDIQRPQDLVVVSVYERDRRLLEFLESLALRPGARFRWLSRNYDETLVLCVADCTIHLGGPAARRIWVKPYDRASTKA
jgi:DtxR family Mn-dependent transcriptional regulator